MPILNVDLIVIIELVCLYAAVVFLVSRWLIPNLPLTAKLLVYMMLTAQLTVVAASMLRHSSPYAVWLLDIDAEWNIPSVVAATQLATVGSVALFTSWRLRNQPAWHRIYFLGIGLIFVFFALDDFFDFESSIESIRDYYFLLGVAVVAATLLVGARMPRSSRRWRITLLAGLALLAIGGMLLDANRRDYCKELAFLRTATDCLLPAHYSDESLEMLGAWLSLIAMLGCFAGAAASQGRLVRRILLVLPLPWMLLFIFASPFPNPPLKSLPNNFQSAVIQFDPGEYIYGYSVEKSADHIIVQTYSFPWGFVYDGIGISVKLVDQVHGGSVAGADDLMSRRQTHGLFGGKFIRVYQENIEVELVPAALPNRAYWVALSLWRERDGVYMQQQVISSELPLLSDAHVILDELVLPADAPASATNAMARFNSGFALDQVLLPARATAGETIDIAFAWRSADAGLDDYTQFLHFIDAESGQWWGYDQSPLGARLPTRLWYSGLADSETWRIPIPSDLAPGRYDVFTGLYRASDLERLPATDAAGALFPDARVPLGSLTIAGEVDV